MPRKRKHISELSWWEFLLFLAVGLFFILMPLKQMDSESIPREQELAQYQGKVEKIVNVRKGDDYLLLQDGKCFFLPGSSAYDLQMQLAKGHEVEIQANREDTGRLRLYTLKRKYGGEVLISYKQAAARYGRKLNNYIFVSTFGCLWTLLLVVSFTYYKCKKRRKRR